MLVQGESTEVTFTSVSGHTYSFLANEIESVTSVKSDDTWLNKKTTE